MLLTPRAHRRHGAVVVESALVYPLFFLLVLGMMVGAAGVFRYQEVSHLAREASRYASTHGGRYAQETGNPAATQQSIYNNVILPNLVMLDPNVLTVNQVQVTWNPSNLPLNVVTSAQVPVASTVTVTVTYNWTPEFFFSSTLPLSSTSTVQMQY